MKDDYSDEFESEEDKPQKVMKPKRALASPRPKSTTKKKMQNGQSSKRTGSPQRGRPRSAPGKSAQQMWLHSAKGVGVKPRGLPAGKRTATEYWNDTLRRTGVGLSTECGGAEPAGRRGVRAYSSTSHYIRRLAGTETTLHLATDANTNGRVTPGRMTPGRPAYKDPEEYYDEILALKKQMTSTNQDNSTLKSKIRRLEEDNLKKEKEIEQLLNPGKSDEMRRTLADRKPDTGMVIVGLKQKILKLEHQLKEKEAALCKLQSDLKTTKIDEMKIQLEQFYKEVVRLNQLKSGASNGPSKVVGKEPSGKVKALQETVLRMNEKNVRLTTENKAMKVDLQKLMDDKDAARERQKDFGEMNKKDLLGVVGRLEKRLDRAETEAASVTSVTSDGERRREKEGKMALEGSVAEKLCQLDARETQLLEDVEKQRSIIRRLKEDRAHYRKRSDQRDKELKTAKKERDDLQEELDTFYDKDKRARSLERSVTSSRGKAAVTPRQPSPRKRQSPRKLSRASSVTSLESEKMRRVEEFRQQAAARHIQREWRQHRSREQNINERRQHVEKFAQTRAAKRIQRGWKERQRQEDAAELLQGALRGHQTRQRRLRSFNEVSRGRDPDSEDDELDGSLDEAADLIQANLRGHQYRKQKLRDSYKLSSSAATTATTPPRSRHHSSSSRRSSASSLPPRSHLPSDSEEAIVQLQSALRGHANLRRQLARSEARPYRSPSPRKRSTESRTKLDSTGEEESGDSRPSAVQRRTQIRRSSPKASIWSGKTRRPVTDEDVDDDDSDVIVVRGRLAI